MARTSEKSPKVAKKAAAKRVTTTPVLLSGGNPQIAKAYGTLPYRPTSPPCRAGNAISGAASTRSSWALSPTYARRSNGTRHFTESGQGWFLGIHCFAKYVKVAFFRGTSLRPIPPGESKQKEVRYPDIHEDDQLDEAQVAAWVKEASQLPGKQM